MIHVTRSSPVRLHVQPSGAERSDPELAVAMATLGRDCWSDTGNQAWYVRSGAAPRLRAVLSPWAKRTQWSGVDPGSADTGRREAPRRGPAATTSGTWAEALLTAVGDRRRDVVFRAMSKVLHPDTETGDEKLMRDLLAAHSKHPGKRSYDEDEVDAFLDLDEEVLRGPTRDILTPEDVRNVAFRLSPFGKRSYNEDEVDAFLDLVEEALRDPTRDILTPEDVRNVAFSKPRLGKRGYSEDEVDAFLDLVEGALRRV